MSLILLFEKGTPTFSYATGTSTVIKSDMFVEKEIKVYEGNSLNMSCTDTTTTHENHNRMKRYFAWAKVRTLPLKY